MKWFFILFVFSSLGAWAQTPTSSPTPLKLKPSVEIVRAPIFYEKVLISIGPTFSNASYSIAGGESRKATSMRIEMEFLNRSIFSLQTGINYVERGFVVKPAADPTILESATELDYLVIPVLAKIRIERSRSGNFYFLGGPYMGFAIGRHNEVAIKDTAHPVTKDDGSISIPTIYTGAGVASAYKTFDYGVRGGLSYELRVGTELNLLLDLSYDFGLANINQSASSPSNKNRTLLGGIGVSVKF